MSRPTLLQLAALAALLAPLCAQGTYYVDGAAGVDAPGRGASPALPWRTIGYAAANAIGLAASPATIQVTGGQTYAAASNGEAFPVTLPPQVQLLGVAANGSLPVLAPPAATTALQLDPLVAHPNMARVHRRLIFQGGAIGFDVGAATSVSHAALIEDCEFQGQSSAGVQATSRGGANSVTVRNCVLDGLGGQNAAGVYSDVSGPAPSQVVTVQGCTIRNWYYGVRRNGSGAPYWSSTFSVSDTTVRTCEFGMLLNAPPLFGPPNAANVTSTTLARVQVADCNFGIDIGSPPGTGASHTVTGADIAVTRCTNGIWLASGGNTSGQYFQSNWTRTLVAQCATGLRLWMSSVSSMTHTFEQSDFLGNTNGIDGFTQLGDFHLNLSRCRVLDGSRGVAVVGSGAGYFGYLDAKDCLIARQSNLGVSTSMAIVQMARCTLADCGTGAFVGDSYGALTGSLLSGNGSDVQINNPPGINFNVNVSATDGAAVPPALGGLQQFPSVGLQRPNYKLAPNSPCIDLGGATSANTFDYEGDPRTGLGDLGADEYMSAGSLNRYGVRSVGDVAASPTIGSTSTAAQIGGSYQIDLAGAAAPGAAAPSLAFLATGVRDTAFPLPVELGPIGLPGCNLLLDPLVLQTMPSTSASGALSTTFALPNQPTLLGFVLCHQWLVGLPQPDGFVTSDALRVTVGQ